MALSIKNPQVELLAREVAGKTGESITNAIRTALEERLLRVQAGDRTHRLRDEIMEISRRCSALPVLDDRPADEILGYGDDGLPH